MTRPASTIDEQAPSATALRGTAYATTAVAVSAVSLLAPNLPELAAVYDVTSESMAWVQSAVLLPGVITAVALMQASRRRRLRGVLVGSLVAYGGFGLVNLVHSSFTVLLTLRLLQGIGGGVLVAAAFALLNRLPPVARERAISRNAALISAMMVVQPLLGSALGAISPRAPFAFYASALLLALALALVLPRIPALPDGRRRARAVDRPTGTTMRSVLAMTVLVNLLVFGWLLFLVPIHLAEAYELGVTARGVLLALQSGSGVVVALATQRVLRSGGEWLALTGAAAVIVIALPLVATTDSLGVVAFGLLMAGSVYGLANPSLVSLATRAQGDSGSGWWQSAARIGQVAGPLAAGALLTLTTVPVAILAGALVAPLALLAVRTMERPGRVS